MSEQPTVTQAISAAAAAIGAVGKNAKMEAGPARYKYRSLDDLMDAVHGPLAEHGVTFAPHSIQMLDTLERTTKSGGTQHHLRAIVTYRVYGPNGDHIEASILAEGSDTGDKAGNKLMSGALKYALGQVLSIPFAMDDQDAYVAEPTQPARQAEQPTVKAVHDAIDHAAETLGVTVEQATAKYRRENGDITLEQFAELPVDTILPFARELAAWARKAPKPTVA